jgi:hypothetical protein
MCISDTRIIDSLNTDSDAPAPDAMNERGRNLRAKNDRRTLYRVSSIAV